MSKKFEKKRLALSIGAVIATSLSAGSIANAETNPFGMSELSSGYMQIAQGTMSPSERKRGGKKAEKVEGKCGEGKCGEGKCGGKKAEKAEGKCGEGKCGEGKCGGKKAEKAEKAEGKCGEGKCGEGKCGGNK